MTRARRVPAAPARALLLALAVSFACRKSGPPVIASFTVDKPAAFSGDVLTFSWQVSGAKTLSIDPGLGIVTGPTAQSVVSHSTTYVLTASNDAGKTTAQLDVSVSPRPATPDVQSFAATPPQAPAGAAVTLRWSTRDAAGVVIDQGVGAQPANGGVVVHPAANTLYTLTAVGAPGALAAPTLQAMFRVAVPPVIESFTADSTSVVQGQDVRLSWRGTAAGWSISDGTTTTALGPVTSLRVAPSPPSTTYTLTAASATGTATRALTVAAAAAQASALAFTAAAPAAGDALALQPDAASTPALAVFRLVALQSLSARALAVNLPLDAKKVSLDSSSLSVNRAAIDPGSPAAAKIALGTGRLADTLVLGIAARATAGVPAADAAIPAGTVIATFSLGLQAAGGPGVVWDSTRPAKAALRNAASASVPISLAAGMLAAH